MNASLSILFELLSDDDDHDDDDDLAMKWLDQKNQKYLNTNILYFNHNLQDTIIILIINLNTVILINFKHNILFKQHSFEWHALTFNLTLPFNLTLTFNFHTKVKLRWFHIWLFQSFIMIFSYYLSSCESERHFCYGN